MISTMEALFSKSETGLSPPETDKNISVRDNAVLKSQAGAGMDTETSCCANK